MHTTEELLEKIDHALMSVPPERKPAELYDPIRYILSLGGKRMRPLLGLMACDMFGGDPNDALPAAVGIELFHNFTLLHDDIMDNAPVRRGKATVHKKWNTNIAILSGDAMFALSLRAIAQTRSERLPEILSIFTQTAIEVCEGQQLDMNFERRNDVTLPEYIEMIRLKTAVLPAAALKIGAIIAGASQQNADNLYGFGENLGIAFQLKDDLLDAFGSAELFGKVSGGDIAANKKTFLYLTSVEKADKETRRSLEKLYSGELSNRDEKVKKVMDIFRSLDISGATTAETAKYYELALGSLGRVSGKRADTSALREFASRLMHREF